MICENIYECDWLFLTQPPKRYWEETENTDQSQRRPEEEQGKAEQNQNKSTVKERSSKRKNGERVEVRVFSI